MIFDAILRFAVVSDTHYGATSADVRSRFKTAMSAIYNYCGTQKHNTLDALYVVGDFTNTGTREQMEDFKQDCDALLKPETKLVVTLANHELHYNKGEEIALQDFREVFQMPTDRHEVINGFHFISVSTTKEERGAWHDAFPQAKQDYLSAELQKARQDTGNLPIFVFQHPGIKGTLGTNYGGGEFHRILTNYPQVIDFSGHSHAPTNSPSELTQRHFTAISTGSLLDIVTHCFAWDSYLQPVKEDIGYEYAHMLVVEVNQKGDVLIKRLDAVAGEFFENDSLITDCWDTTRYTYTSQRAVHAKRPYFTPDSLLSAKKQENSLLLTFPRGLCEGERVKEYRVRLLDPAGVVLAQKTVPSDFPAVHQAPIVEIPMDYKDAGTVQIQVFAVGFWDNLSEPITCSISL